MVVGSVPKQKQISFQAAFVVRCPLDSLTMKARSEMKLPTYVSCPELSRSGAWEAPDPERCLHRWYRLSDVSLICKEDNWSGKALPLLWCLQSKDMHGDRSNATVLCALPSQLLAGLSRLQRLRSIRPP